MERHAPRPVTISRALYRRLIAAYPRSFREAFGSEIVRTFGECCEDAYRHRGIIGLADVWGHALVDLVISVAEEYALPTRMHAMFLLASGHLPTSRGDDGTFACPFCSEEMIPGERRCVYCGADLTLCAPLYRSHPPRQNPVRKSPGYAAAQIIGESRRFYDWAYGEPPPRD